MGNQLLMVLREIGAKLSAAWNLVPNGDRIQNFIILTDQTTGIYLIATDLSVANGRHGL